MHKYQAKDLFQLQTELIDIKVDMAAYKAIDRVVEQIGGLKTLVHTEIHALRNDMHGFREEMNNQFSSLDKRVIAVEVKLGKVNDRRDKISTTFIQYMFKAGWVVLAGFFSCLFYLLFAWFINK